MCVTTEFELPSGRDRRQSLLQLNLTKSSNDIDLYSVQYISDIERRRILESRPAHTFVQRDTLRPATSTTQLNITLNAHHTHHGMLIIFESVLMLFTQNYQNKSMLDETTACQSCYDTVGWVI